MYLNFLQFIYIILYIDKIFFFQRVLVSNFTEDQLDRYEMYRRAAFPKAAIKRVIIFLLHFL